MFFPVSLIGAVEDLQRSLKIFLVTLMSIFIKIVKAPGQGLLRSRFLPGQDLPRFGSLIASFLKDRFRDSSGKNK